MIVNNKGDGDQIIITIGGKEISYTDFFVRWFNSFDGDLKEIREMLDKSTQLDTTQDINVLREEYAKQIEDLIKKANDAIDKKIKSINARSLGLTNFKKAIKEVVAEEIKKSMTDAVGIANLGSNGSEEVLKKLEELRILINDDKRVGVSDLRRDTLVSGGILSQILDRLEKIEKGIASSSSATAVVVNTSEPVVGDSEPTPTGNTGADNQEDNTAGAVDPNGNQTSDQDKPTNEDTSAEGNNQGDANDQTGNNANNQEDDNTTRKPDDDFVRGVHAPIPEVFTEIDNTDGNSNPTDNTPSDDNVEDNTPTPTGEPEPVIEDKKPTEYRRARFLSKSLKQTAILAEPKRPWYKRLAKFAINHPVLTTIAGAGIGLGVVGAMCGITAAAGLTGMLSMANFFLPSLAIGTGIGAVGGGVFSGIANLLPGSRRERLYKKFAKQYKKSMKIDKTKDLFAVLEQKHQKAREEAREKNKNKKGLFNKLGVYKATREYHKIMAKANRKMKIYYAKKFAPSVEKALTTKNKLNTEEVKKGKTMAVAGYLQKRKKIENKLAEGKIDEDEFQEDMADLEEDVKDLEGGEPGISETRQHTYDKEAVHLIEKVKKDKRSNGMNAMLDNIKKRNSKQVVDGVIERVYRDPAYLEKEIERLKAENKLKEAEALAKELRENEIGRIEYQLYARENGEEVDTPQELTAEEVMKLMKGEEGHEK